MKVECILNECGKFLWIIGIFIDFFEDIEVVENEELEVIMVFLKFVGVVVDWEEDILFVKLNGGFFISIEVEIDIIDEFLFLVV